MHPALARLSPVTRSLAREAWARAPLADRHRCVPGDSGAITVAITTYPARVPTLPLTLRSVLKGSHAPRRVVVVLAQGQFPGGPPEEVTRFAERGVEVLMTQRDTRSYKKLLPVLEAYPDEDVVTADDDVYYRPDWLGRFVTARRQWPGQVLGLRGTVVQGDLPTVTPYGTWPEADVDSPGGRVFLKGVGGILYPARSLPERVHDVDLAMRLAPNADDIWFKAMTLLAGRPARRIISARFRTPYVRGSQTSSLMDVNIAAGQNDSQFTATMDHFDLWDRMDSLR